MVAILTPDPRLHPAGHLRLTPSLTLLEGGRSDCNMARTYRRRRIGALAAVMLLGVAGLAGFGAVLHAVTPSTTPASVAAAAAIGPGNPTVEVQVGDTWPTMARRIQPRGDVSSLITQLTSLNGADALRPGSRVVLPG